MRRRDATPAIARSMAPHSAVCIPNARTIGRLLVAAAIAPATTLPPPHTARARPSWEATSLAFSESMVSQCAVDRVEWEPFETDVVESTAMASNPVFTFPADRAQRTTLLSGSSPAERLRFWTLTEHIAYPDVRNIVADYINSTISDPANTQRHRWTVEALTPSGSDHERRLLTVTCGNLETLFVTEYSNEADDTIELEMTVNTAIPGGYTAQQLDISTDVVSATRGSYSSHEVWTWRIDLGALLTDDAEVDFGIDDELFDDLAYTLNTQLMSGDAQPETTDHSEDLASDLLAEAYRQLVDAM